jgi:PAS domain-containing protein
MNAPHQPAPCLEVGEAQFRAILDAIPARVALLDRERRHCYANREYAAFVDRRPEELLGHLGIPSFYILLHLALA